MKMNQSGCSIIFDFFLLLAITGDYIVLILFYQMVYNLVLVSDIEAWYKTYKIRFVISDGFIMVDVKPLS